MFIFWWFSENSTLQNSPWRRWRSGFYRHYYAFFYCRSSAVCFRIIVLLRVQWSLQCCRRPVFQGWTKDTHWGCLKIPAVFMSKSLDRCSAGTTRLASVKADERRFLFTEGDTGEVTWAARRGLLQFKRYSEDNSSSNVKKDVICVFFNKRRE